MEKAQEVNVAVEYIYRTFSNYTKYNTDEELFKMVEECAETIIKLQRNFREKVALKIRYSHYTRSYKRTLLQLFSHLFCQPCDVRISISNGYIYFIGEKDCVQAVYKLFDTTYNCIFTRCLSEYAKKYNMDQETANVFNERAEKYVRDLYRKLLEN